MIDNPGERKVEKRYRRAGSQTLNHADGEVGEFEVELGRLLEWRKHSSHQGAGKQDNSKYENILPG